MKWMEYFNMSFIGATVVCHFFFYKRKFVYAPNKFDLTCSTIYRGENEHIK